MAKLIALGWAGDEDRDHKVSRWARKVVRGWNDPQLRGALQDLGLDRAPRLMTTSRAIRTVLRMDDVACVDGAILRPAMVDEGGVGDAVGLGEGGALAFYVLRNAVRSKTLYVSGVEDGRIPTETRLLAEVDVVEANYAGIQDVGNEIADLIQLRRLSLKGNPIRTLTPELGRLQELRALYLDECNLKTMPESVMAISNLRALSLGYNQLTKLPESFADLQNLTTLWVNDNPLESLPDSLPTMEKLTFLHLTNHLWATPPDVIWDIESLETLWLVSHSLTELPEDIARLKNLKELSIWYSELTSLPDALFEMTHLTELRVRGNPLPEGTLDALKEALPNCTIY